MFKLSNKVKLSEKLNGVFSSSIQYEVRVKDGNWSPYFGHYQNQKWGLWDSNSCWCLSAVNCVEDQLEYLHKNRMFSKEAMDFFYRYGFIDMDGDFSISERYLEILGRHTDNGGSTIEAYYLMQIYGCIPRDMLTYTKTKADSFSNKKDFNADYFNPTAVTDDMKKIGQEFLKFVNIARQKIGKTWITPDLQILKAALRQAPLTIGVPIPEGMWNYETVVYNGKKTAEHAIQLYGIDDEGNYLIFDQYMPNLKKLSANYFIPIVSQGIVTAIPQVVANPIKQDTIWNKVWEAVFGWFNSVA